MISTSTAIPCIPTKDIAAARRFYEGVLGLHVVDELGGGVTFEVGDGRLYLYETESAGLAKHTLCNFESAHIDDDIADLRSRGISFETYDLPYATFDSGGVATMRDEEHDISMKGVWFTDPDGNVLGMFEQVRVPAAMH